MTPPDAAAAVRAAAGVPSPGSPQPEPVIVTHGLVKRFGSTVALAGLDLTVGRGEVFGSWVPTGRARRPP